MNNYLKIDDNWYIQSVKRITNLNEIDVTTSETNFYINPIKVDNVFYFCNYSKFFVGTCDLNIEPTRKDGYWLYLFEVLSEKEIISIKEDYDELYYDGEDL